MGFRDKWDILYGINNPPVTIETRLKWRILKGISRNNNVGYT